MSFPSKQYSSAQEKWLGRDHLITPSIRKAFEEIGGLEGKSVLDVGCGNGHYSLDFVRWGAQKVVGIDNSNEMIKQSKTALDDSNFGEKIRFELADVSKFCINSQFDVVTAFFVLQFIHDKETLRNAIFHIGGHLKKGGVVVGLIPNGVEGLNPPEDMGQKLGASIDKKKGSPFVDGELVKINFYDNNEICGNATIALHSRQFYENAFKDAGFDNLEWITPHFTDYAKNLLGQQFCAQFSSPPVDVLFRATKTSND